MISQKESGVGLTGGRRISEFLSRVNSFFPSRLWSFSSIFLVTEPFGFNRRLSLPSSQLWRGREVEVHKRATIELTGTWKKCPRLSVVLLVSYIENMRAMSLPVVVSTYVTKCVLFTNLLWQLEFPAILPNLL